MQGYGDGNDSGSGSAKFRKLTQKCNLHCRIYEVDNGPDVFEPFCELQGADRNLAQKSRNGFRITGGNGVAASARLIDAAATGSSEFFVGDALIDEETGKLIVADGSENSVQVSLCVVANCSVRSRENLQRQR